MKLFTAIDRYVFRLVIMPMIAVFLIAASAYLSALLVVHLLVPRLEPAQLKA